MTIEEELIDHEYYLRDLLRDEYAISDDTVLDLHRYYMPDAKVTRKTIDYKDFAEWIKEKIYYYSRKQNLTVNEKNMLDKFSYFKFNQLNSLPKYHDGFEHEKEREEKFFTKYKRMNKEERKVLTNQMTMVAMALHNY